MAIKDPRERCNTSAEVGEDVRWHEIWQLVVSAERQPLAERREFILRAQADSFVIRQAIAILEGSASMVSYTSTSPSTSPPESSHFLPQVGMKIGRYRVGTLLGSGATGSVYAGFDEELNRAVAIKFFQSHRQSKNGGPALPLREARAASALNHPNIIMVLEVIETEDVDAIVMEFVPGVTLRVLAGTFQRMGDILHWSVQLANALAAAHANSLIHGDVKPENVMVRDDGYLKLLDFGLAWSSLSEFRNRASLTGTPRYLSPEQCLGNLPTPASDVFSFGVLLYELTTGRHPFPADGMLALLQQIITTDPARPVSVNSKLPRSLDRLIMEMLSKQPEQRPTAQQTNERLAVIAQETVGPKHSMAAVRIWWWALAALTVMVGASLLLLKREPHSHLDFSGMKVRPLASQPGLETDPSISPDGKWVSCLYRKHPNDRPQFQVHGAQGGTGLAIDTGDITVEQAAAWSPDAKLLAFIGLDRSGKRFLYQVGRASGFISKIAECHNVNSCEIDWSPDGRSLALTDFVPGKSIRQLLLVDPESGKRRPLLEIEHSILSPRFSPDGKWLAFSRVASLMSSDLCLIPVSGGPVRCLTPQPWWFRGLAWTKDSQSIIAVSAQKSDHPEMWQFPISGPSEPFRVTAFDLGRARDIRVARGKGSIVWVLDLSATSIWRMPVDQPDAPAEQLVNSAGLEQDAEWSRQGRMVFYSDRSGSAEIWVARADGSEQAQATHSRGPYVGDPHWSPDGRQLAFTGHPDGNADIFAMNCDVGGPQPCAAPTQLTRSPATDANPTWSADGQWIYFSSNRSGSFEVWKMRAAGGEPVRVTWNGGYMARESADGGWLYYSKIERGRGFWRRSLPLTGPGQREEVVVANMPFSAGATWALGIRNLYYYPSEPEGSTDLPSVRAIDLDSGKASDLPTGNTILGRGLSLSPEGDWLLRTQKDRAISLVMIAE